jgi:hypothetical protein
MKAEHYYLTECPKILLRQLHEQALAPSPAPTIALYAADPPLAVVVNLDERSLVKNGAMTSRTRPPFQR